VKGLKRTRRINRRMTRSQQKLAQVYLLTNVVSHRKKTRKIRKTRKGRKPRKIRKREERK